MKKVEFALLISTCVDRYFQRQFACFSSLSFDLIKSRISCLEHFSDAIFDSNMKIRCCKEQVSNKALKLGSYVNHLHKLVQHKGQLIILWISFLGFQLNQKDSQVAAQQIEFLKA
jgi:hypothetical protein